jgi:hypothetical protein
MPLGTGFCSIGGKVGYGKLENAEKTKRHGKNQPDHCYEK